jgi:hypothetical protein
LLKSCCTTKRLTRRISIYQSYQTVSRFSDAKVFYCIFDITGMLVL